ncbi:MAG: hypothetical protein ACOYIO_09360 [Eubacteriales bacterium]|jgi:hypothetical protein
MKDVLTNHADASVRPSETVRMKNAAAETGIETEKEANKCSFTDAETAKAAVPDEACAEGTQQTAAEEELEEAAKGVPCADENTREVGEEKTGSESAFGALYALADAFPDNDVAHDVSSKAFRLFADGRDGDMKSLYQAYLALREAFGVAENGAKAHTRSEMFEDEPADDGGLSRFYSSFSGGLPVSDYAETLTARQMLMARQSGMSYREYAELLHSVPQGNGRRRADKTEF